MEKQVKILYLDDEEILLDVYNELFNVWGLQLETYSDPRQALDAIANAQHPYDLALIDYKMPGLNGLEFVKFLEQNNFSGVNSIAIFSSMFWSEEICNELANEGYGPGPRVAWVNKEVAGHQELKNFLKDSLGVAI